jgi:hypothetical protein
MILEGKRQAEIIHELGVSPNTFSRTRKWLSGQIPEYDKAIKDYRAEQKRLVGESKRTPCKSVAPFSLAFLKKKYPTHFLLLKLIDQANQKTD